MVILKIIFILIICLLEIGTASFAEKVSGEISPEDAEIIENLELLQNLELIQDNDLALWQNYDEVKLVKTEEGKTDE